MSATSKLCDTSKVAIMVVGWLIEWKDEVEREWRCAPRLDAPQKLVRTALINPDGSCSQTEDPEASPNWADGSSKKRYH